jgi:hypothetical protein
LVAVRAYETALIKVAAADGVAVGVGDGVAVGVGDGVCDGVGVGRVGGVGLPVGRRVGVAVVEGVQFDVLPEGVLLDAELAAATAASY